MFLPLRLALLDWPTSHRNGWPTSPEYASIFNLHNDFLFMTEEELSLLLTQSSCFAGAVPAANQQIITFVTFGAPLRI